MVWKASDKRFLVTSKSRLSTLISRTDGVSGGLAIDILHRFAQQFSDRFHPDTFHVNHQVKGGRVFPAASVIAGHEPMPSPVPLDYEPFRLRPFADPVFPHHPVYPDRERGGNPDVQSVGKTRQGSETAPAYDDDPVGFRYGPDNLV